MAVRFGSTHAHIVWSPDIGSIRRNLLGHFRKATTTWERINREVAEELEEWMRDHHPWQNVTQGAHDSLTAFPQQKRFELSIDLFYQDLAAISAERYGRYRDYSVFLETMKGGSLGIIRPTVRRAEEIVMRRFHGTFGAT